MQKNSPLFSIFASNIPPTAVFACCTSFKSSAATDLCLSNGCDNGDSITGSIGSRGLIKCTKMHNFGSDTSRTLKGLVGFVPSAEGGGSYRGLNKKQFQFVNLVSDGEM